MNIRIRQDFWVPAETQVNAATRITDTLWAAGTGLNNDFAVTADALTGADL